ncbi:hypothetical protein HMPREF1141_3171 [Clostridium sp. MSTE9]|nr:hypothetical protein HMPREF1141_3171 [Clostridium sp. MSTE9]
MLSNKLDAFNKTILWKLYNLTNSVFFCAFSRILLTAQKNGQSLFYGDCPSNLAGPGGPADFCVMACAAGG